MGSERFGSVVPDNAPVMKAAWKIVESKFPHIAAHGCAAHAINLLIKDLLDTPENSETLKNSEKIIKFVNNHHLVKAKYENKSKESNIPFSMPVSTRWFSRFKATSHLLASKYILIKLVDKEEENLKEITPKPASSAVSKLVKSMNFWYQLGELVKLIEYPANIIGKVESDEASLSMVYRYFGELYNHYDNDEKKQKVKRRLKFLFTSHLGHLGSYMLTPRFAASGFYFDEDKPEFMALASEISSKVCPEDNAAVENEMVLFVGEMSALTGTKQKIIHSMIAKQYWDSIGRERFPKLS